MKHLTALFSASALALGGLMGAGMMAPGAAYAAPACGGSIDDWRDADEAASYSGSAKTNDDSAVERTVSLEGDTAWVPGETNKVTYTFAAGKLTWYIGDEHGGTSFSLSSPECAPGDTRVTGAQFEESSGGQGGGGAAAGRLTRG
ncbi:hypothetical protein [Streptomyces sp. NPDC060035]|uniref:hypothetical protein n=1 Tax=Streptomyces sp. NPDC060035 TaxID=3347044 RepID=UPI003682DCBF